MSDVTTRQVDLDRLAAAVRSRRAELGLSQDEVHARGGPSAATLWKIENARPPAPRENTLRLTDVGLGWPAGYARAVLLDHVLPEVEAASPAGDLAPLAEPLFELTINGHRVVVAGRDTDPDQLMSLVAAAVTQLAAVVHMRK